MYLADTSSVCWYAVYIQSFNADTNSKQMHWSWISTLQQGQQDKLAKKTEQVVMYCRYWHWTAGIKEATPLSSGVRWWTEKGWGWATGWGQCFVSLATLTLLVGKIGRTSGLQNTCANYHKGSLLEQTKPLGIGINQATGYWNKPSHWVCKPAYLVPVPSQDKLGGLQQERYPA